MSEIDQVETQGAKKHGVPTRVFHWLAALALAAVYATLFCKGLFPRGSEGREMVWSFHFGFGLFTGLMVFPRLLARATGPKMAPLEGPEWRGILATLMHVALYALMIIVPLTGWLASPEKMDVPMAFGLITLPYPPSLGFEVEELHEGLGWTMAFLVAGHAAAGFIGQYLKKDGTLERML